MTNLKMLTKQRFCNVVPSNKHNTQIINVLNSVFLYKDKINLSLKDLTASRG